ncbi:uncharacterized protein SETTUDRAFT_150113 [Exserohilum turcica Et28A]|uniref:Pseudouridine synthase I TruA alpha/beta domain-containing protein n=1 Tax=Exserohilum turcicum (strain 28A) TaxID=671987 RepID=R0KF86_EXST2|nr:uncharacterized protein SETTUDRAFT_150113 [Exserohilum turcica Et28A]EOA87979.1 hypothetical protein SETTUDRAFT_150113 [Exserohilum turcica Et28A]
MAGYEDWSQQQLIARIQELEKQIGAPASDTPHSSATPAPAVPVAEQTSSSTGFPEPLEIRKAAKPPPKAFDASRYSTRLIALKFAYLGQKYNGFEHHKNNSTPLPTIEEELWKALVKTRLITPVPTRGEGRAYERIDKKTYAAWDREGADVNWDGCEYSKCGRTDRGVSAFGQVIGIRVRSNRPLPKTAEPPQETSVTTEEDDDYLISSSKLDPEPTSRPFNDLTDELAYIQLLNRVLPPDIRVYAWCPNPPPGFNARFSCKERRYKYFFTNPSFAPVPGSSGLYSTSSPTTEENKAKMREGWLDIDAMRQGCKSLISLHDFRNFCKIDASKQISNFQRRIYHADIEEVSSLSVPGFLSHPALQVSGAEQPKLYSFTLHGSAFLWHQVRSLVAILFLIGQGLESPSLVPHLLDTSANPTRPKYEMATDAPLVLWDCIFPHPEEVQTSEEREHGYQDSLNWIYVGDEGGSEPKAKGPAKKGGPATIGNGKWGRGGVIDDVWEVWHAKKIEETLSGLLMDKVAALGSDTLDAEVPVAEQTVSMAKGGPRIFDGGDFGRAKGVYTPVLNRERQEPVEVVNEKYRIRKGIDADRFKGREEDADE